MQPSPYYAPPEPPYPSAPKRTSVGGWLLFFIVTLVFIRPVVTLIGIAGLLALGQPALLLLSFFDVALAAYSIYVGVTLWRIAPGAVGKAKVFLAVSFVVALVSTILVAIVASQADLQIRGEILMDIVRAGGYSAIWYSYLQRSTRVAETYGTEVDGPVSLRV